MQTNTPCTDHFRAEHTSVRRGLDAIEAELAAAPDTDDSRPTRDAFLGLIILFERDLARHLDDEERLLYAALRHHGVGDDAVLHACFQEHGDIRVGVQTMRRVWSRAFPGTPGVVAELKDCAARMITLVREHLEREEGSLFPRAETILTAAVLERPDASGHCFPSARSNGRSAI
ncbi:MAG: hemerythrin domain-containing protein [Candidatus Riflebacteria bacterium]|nr:hemerythrin domain-containing protein [Candidatus Riflebacteria bacterium]